MTYPVEPRCYALVAWADPDPSPDRCGQPAVACSLVDGERDETTHRCARHPEDGTLRWMGEPPPIAWRLEQGLIESRRVEAAQLGEYAP